MITLQRAFLQQTVAARSRSAWFEVNTRNALGRIRARTTCIRTYGLWRGGYNRAPIYYSAARNLIARPWTKAATKSRWTHRLRVCIVRTPNCHSANPRPDTRHSSRADQYKDRAVNSSLQAESPRAKPKYTPYHCSLTQPLFFYSSSYQSRFTSRR